MLLKKVVCFILLLAFTANSLQPGYAQSVLPVPGVLANPYSEFHPVVFKGLKVYPKEPLRFDFILDPGTRSGAEADLVSVRQESGKLIKYFLASLTIPETDLWVNLSPYEKDRIIPEAFGQTEMGRDLLEQDYILKQITASLLYPQGETGKRFWQKVYALAQEKYGTTDIPVDTFNKVWIVPEKAEVYENVKAGAVYITDSRLKVMLDVDYGALAQKAATGSGETGGSVLVSVDGSSDNGAQEIARTVLREVVVPVLEQEVNEGVHFALLRQVYQSLILATWYKKKIRKSLLTAMYVDQNKISGVEIDDPGEAEKIWQRYVESFRQGAFSLVQEEENVYPDGAVPRKYFSGGLGMDMAVLRVNTLEPDASQLRWSNDYLMVSSQVNFSTDLSSGSSDNVATSKKPLDGADSAQFNADTRVTFWQGVFGPWEMSRQVRAERILETIKTLDGLWGDVVSIEDLPKGASPAMPLDLSEVLSFYPEESFRLTNRHLILPAAGVSRVDLLVRSENRWFRSEGWDQGGNIAFKVPVPEVLESLSAQKSVRRLADQDNSTDTGIDPAAGPVIIDAIPSFEGNLELPESYHHFLLRANPGLEGFSQIPREGDIHEISGATAALRYPVLYQHLIEQLRAKDPSRDGILRGMILGPSASAGISYQAVETRAVLSRYYEGLSELTLVDERKDALDAALNGTEYTILDFVPRYPNYDALTDLMADFLVNVSGDDLRLLADRMGSLRGMLFVPREKREFLPIDMEKFSRVSLYGILGNISKIKFPSPEQETRLDFIIATQVLNYAVLSLYWNEGRKTTDPAVMFDFFAGLIRQLKPDGEGKLYINSSDFYHVFFLYNPAAPDFYSEVAGGLKARAGLEIHIEKDNDIIVVTNETQETILADKGGIDLDPRLIAPGASADGEIEFDIDPAMLERFRDAHGLSPVILSVHTGVDVKSFLGILR